MNKRIMKQPVAHTCTPDNVGVVLLATRDTTAVLLYRLQGFSPASTALCGERDGEQLEGKGVRSLHYHDAH